MEDIKQEMIVEATAKDVEVGDTVMIDKCMELRQHLQLEESWIFEVGEVTFYEKDNHWPYCDHILLFCLKDGNSACVLPTEVIPVIEK